MRKEMCEETRRKIISLANTPNARCLRNTYLDLYSKYTSTLTTTMKIATLNRVAKCAAGCPGVVDRHPSRRRFFLLTYNYKCSYYDFSCSRDGFHARRSDRERRPGRMKARFESRH